MSKVFSVKEAAERLGVTRRTINHWIRQGQFPGVYKLNPNARNSPYRIPESDIAALEERRQERQTPSN